MGGGKRTKSTLSMANCTFLSLHNKIQATKSKLDLAFMTHITSCLNRTAMGK